MPTRRRNPTIGFNIQQFETDLQAVMAKRSIRSYAEVSLQTGVERSILYYMKVGQVPHTVNMAALGRWAGLDLAAYSFDILD